MKTLPIVVLLFCLALVTSCNKNEKKDNVDPVKLEFRLVVDDNDESNLVFSDDVFVDNFDIQEARTIFDSEDNVYILLEMTGEGKKKLADATEKCVGKRIAILIDGKILFAPYISEPISGGWVQFTSHDMTIETAEPIAEGMLKYKEVFGKRP